MPVPILTHPFSPMQMYMGASGAPTYVSRAPCSIAQSMALPALFRYTQTTSLTQPQSCQSISDS